MKKYPFQELSLTNAPYAALLKETAARVIDSGWYLHGYENEILEKDLAKTVGTRFAVTVGCGLDAIRLIFRAYLELGRLHPGDAVAVQANTFIASVLPISELGIRVHLVEPHPQDHAADFSRLLKAVEEDPDVKAVMPVHLYGTPLWDFEIAKRIKEKGVLIVEDACQAIGASVMSADKGWIMAGNLGDAAAFSFYPGKNIGALGDGGAVTTNDPELAEMVRTLANYGSSEKYRHDVKGYNSRLDELQAAFLNVKLSFLGDITNRRNEIADIYCTGINNPHVSPMRKLPGLIQVWHQYVVTSDHRDKLREYLDRNGVGTMIHYPIPIHKQRCYAEEMAGVSLPVSESLANQVLSLPIANISAGEAKEICEIINRFRID